MDKDVRHGELLEKIKSIEIKEFAGYDLVQILYNELYSVQTISVKTVVKRFIRALCFSTELDYTKKNSEMVLLSTKWHRKDHDQYWEQICEAFPEGSRITIHEKSNTRQTFLKKFSLVKYVQSTSYILKISKHFSPFCKRMERLYIASQLKILVEFKTRLDEMHLVPQVAMCYFDSGFYENFAMQYFKKKGAITITNQHGQPVFKSWEFDRYNQSQILNYKCDYFLAKGEYTRKQFKNAGLDSDSVRVIGSFNTKKDFQRNYQERKQFCVFLNCIDLPSAKENNNQLIDMALRISNELNYRFYIKIHPLDNVENYSHIRNECLMDILGKESALVDVCSDIDFALLSESAIYLDLLDNKVKAYRWDNGKPFPLIEEDSDCFVDVEDFLVKYKNWLSMSNQEKETFFQRISGYYNGDGLATENIKQCVADIINEERNNA